MEKMNRKKPLVFLDVSIDGDPFERMTFELFTDVAPKTAENFRALCTGEKGLSPKTGKPLHYKGTFFHRIIKGCVARGGDFLQQDGKYGESIYDGNFLEGSPKLKHDGPGLLSMAISDQDERGSLFSVTFKADHHLDRECVVFGKLVGGHEVLKKIENAGDEEGRPAVTVKITNSGELPDDKKKGNKLKMGKDAVEENNHKVERKEKSNKSSKKMKRKRRYYTSESDSSTDTDWESSESDSDSDLYASSLSDTSSSSDDRRKKRKRSKRDRHRRGKKDRRREKRRKRQRDKKSRRKSRRDSSSDSESDSKSGSSSKDDAEVGALDRKPKSSGNQSPLVADQETAPVNHKKAEAVYMSEREKGEFPSENGGHQSNGMGMGMGSDRIADRHPDVVDDLPTKSRSRSLSPGRAMSRSMIISPRRSSGKSPGIGAKHERSRSPTVSRTPRQISTRSNSAVRSGNSRSPIRSPQRSEKNRGVSMSPPARSHSQRSRTRSPTISPSRRMVTRSPPRTSSRRSPLKSDCRGPVRSSWRTVSGSSGKPSRRSPSRSPVRFRISSGRAPPRRIPSPSAVREPSRTNRHINSRSPLSTGRRARSPASERSQSSSRSPSIDGSPKCIRRGRAFSYRYSYGCHYRSHSHSRSCDRSPLRSYRYSGRDRYPSYRRSPRRFRSSPRGRTPPRYRGRRSRTRSPIRSSNRRYSHSRSLIGCRSPTERYRGSPRTGRRRSPSRSRSRSGSPSSHNSQSPRHANNGNLKSSSGSPPRKPGLVSYGDNSPDTGSD